MKIEDWKWKSRTNFRTKKIEVWRPRILDYLRVSRGPDPYSPPYLLTLSNISNLSIGEWFSMILGKKIKIGHFILYPPKISQGPFNPLRARFEVSKPIEIKNKNSLYCSTEIQILYTGCPKKHGNSVTNSIVFVMNFHCNS